MTASTAIKTSQVTGRRKLHFNNLDEVVTDVDALAAADRAGKLHQLGNWPLGQALGHLAGWMEFSFDGVPMKMPWLIRVFMRMLKNRILYKSMPAGSNIPGVKGGTLAIAPMTLEEGLIQFHQAAARLKAESPSIPHLAFGPMSHDEWLNLHLRHSELHLSFFRVD